MKIKVNGIAIDATSGVVIQIECPKEGGQIGQIDVIIRGGPLHVKGGHFINVEHKDYDGKWPWLTVHDKTGGVEIVPAVARAVTK